jgi:hypothetical protein
MNNQYGQQGNHRNGNENSDFFFLPANGGGALVQKEQIIGARPNGNEGAIVYTAAGPSIYTTMTTQDLAKAFEAQAL